MRSSPLALPLALALSLLPLPACSPPSTGHGGTGGTGGTCGGSGNAPPATHDVVDPSLPPGVVGGFDGAPTTTSGVTLVYPNPNALIPHDLAPIDVQWNSAATVFRVTFAVDNGNKLRGYVKSASFIPPAAEWQWLLDVSAGHTISLTVDGATAIDASGTPQPPLLGSSPQPLRVSHDDASGALFYFATTGDQLTGDGTLERLELGAQKADKYLNKTNDGGRCVGCHSLTRDGKRVAFTFLDLLGVPSGATMSLGDVDATNPTAQQAAANTQAATSTFNPDGTRLVTSYEGHLALRDGVTGAKLADIATSGPALFPDWSPDGTHLVFVRPSALCTPSGVNFGQASIFAYGGALVTMTANGATFGNETVLLPAAAGENNFYPSYSPDGQYIVFARASTSSKSSWAMANSSCLGQDGSGLSYDNPSSTIFIIPAAGGTPMQLASANGAPLHTNSWPKWGPKADGEYLWLSFSSTRDYGNVLTGLAAHHQVWISAIPRVGATGDPSSPAVWFPFQDTATKNHIGVWSLKVGVYQIP
jgi:Tol biopolymer transport system component